MDISYHSICRICVNNKEDLENIFDEGIADRIMTFSFVQIIFDSNLPQYICKKCLEELWVAIRFKEKCEKSQTKFYLFIDESLSNINKNTNELKSVQTYDDNFENNTKFEKNEANEVLSSIEPEVEKPSVYSNNITDFCSIYQSSTFDFDQQNCNIDTEDKITTFELTEKEVYESHLKKHMTFKCNECAETFSEQSNLDKHVQVNHSLKTIIKRNVYQCEYCGKIAKCRADLLKHMTIHTNERPHKCQTCGKTFRLRSFLVKHNVTHGSVRNHHCYYCPKSFALKSSLTSHLKTHSGEKKFTCNICNKKFKSSRSLHYHIKLHTDERNFPCTQCEKAFVNKFDLRRHLKLHEKYQQIQDGTYDSTKERPKQFHQCETCGKFFPSRGDLKKHFRIHSGEKPFECSYCEKTFTSSSALKVHIRTHTGTKPYKCQFCNQSFAQSSNLKVHVRLHTDDKPFVCLICNKGFNRKRDLEAHGKIHPILPDKLNS